jgi:hypothetical protein
MRLFGRMAKCSLWDCPTTRVKSEMTYQFLAGYFCSEEHLDRFKGGHDW